MLRGALLADFPRFCFAAVVAAVVVVEWLFRLYLISQCSQRRNKQYENAIREIFYYLFFFIFTFLLFVVGASEVQASSKDSKRDSSRSRESARTRASGREIATVQLQLRCSSHGHKRQFCIRNGNL